MIGYPRDRNAYGLAIAGLALALAILIAGICWIAAGSTGAPAEVSTHHCGLHAESDCEPGTSFRAAHDPVDVPNELWIALAVLGGVFVGVLVPFPPPGYRGEGWSEPEARGPLYVLSWTVLITLVAVLAARGFEDSIGWYAIAGALLGLQVPSPASGE